MSDEAISGLNSEQITKVVDYIDKMKYFDRSNFIKLQEVNDLVWGYLFLMGGILDYLFYQTDRPQLSAIPWLLMSIGGMSISLFINSRKRQEILTEEINQISEKMKNMYRGVVLLTIVSWVAFTAIVSIFDLVFLILPMVSFLIGTTIVVANLASFSQVNFKKFYNPKQRLAFLPFVCYLSTIVNLVGYAIIDDFIGIMGLVTGFLLAFGFGSGAFIRRW
ncbi:MAG: hypothetical protein ACXAE3_01705 [Candidatus Kariarchaeaceae archaeon]|jgi:hypothetical protein